MQGPRTIDAFFAPLYWGFVLSTALFGATLIQGYIYFNRSRDPLIIQLAITVMLILDLSSTLVMASTISHYFIVNFGNFNALHSIPPEWVAESALTAVLTCIAQLFFASRIRIIIKQYAIFGRFEEMIPGIISCTAILALVKTVIIGTIPAVQLGGPHMIIATSFEEGLAFVSDLFTTCTLCGVLASSRGSLRMKRSPMRRLFFFILNRGILVTVVQIGALIAFLTMPNSMNWAPFHLAKSKLYTNTLLAMLNSRVQSDRVAPRTPCLERNLPLQEVSNEDRTQQLHSEIPHQDRIQGGEYAKENLDAHPELPTVEKDSSC